jgi:hypothetical protein
MNRDCFLAAAAIVEPGAAASGPSEGVTPPEVGATPAAVPVPNEGAAAEVVPVPVVTDPGAVCRARVSAAIDAIATVA